MAGGARARIGTLPRIARAIRCGVAAGARAGIGTLRRIAREIRCDVAAARERDPAARGVSSLEILLNWPGVHALLAHRVSSTLHGARVPLLPRAMALATRAITNIE